MAKLRDRKAFNYILRSVTLSFEMNRLKQRVTFVPFGNALNPEYLRDGLIFLRQIKAADWKYC